MKDIGGAGNALVIEADKIANEKLETQKGQLTSQFNLREVELITALKSRDIGLFIGPEDNPWPSRNPESRASKSPGR